jgi:Na+-translocating ferredoxin:NAD+ oxidoreductase RnfC subunit
MIKKELLDKIRKAGVLGAGGGGFPAYKKLVTNVEHVIANGVECEPLLYKDREVMLRETDKMLKGLEIVREITGAENVTIAIKQKNRDAAEMIKSRVDKSGFNIFITKDVYPAGDEYILVYDITGRRIPPNGIPLMVGCLVNNVETLVNISNAIEDKPVTEKFITITGAVRNPVTTSVPVGTSFKDCIDFAGGFTIDDPVVLTGGVMMGGVETDLSLPVTKTLGGLIVLPPDHNLAIRKSSPQKVYNKTGHSTCDQCSFCTQLCPRYILGYPIQPHLVMRSLLMTGAAREELNLWAAACCECNVCSLFACPEKLDPKNICADTKIRLNEEKKGFTKEQMDEAFRDVHPAREGREIPISNLYQRLGIKSYDRKADFKIFDKKIRELLIPLKYNFGKAADPVVSIGSNVTAGEMIASASENDLNVPVHSGIDGIVKEISEKGILISENY